MPLTAPPICHLSIPTQISSGQTHYGSVHSFSASSPHLSVCWSNSGTENMPRIHVTPEERRRVRLFRLRGLRAFKVSEIAGFLPLLLQVAVILFLVGLIIFTRTVHKVIGCIVTSLVAVWLTFLVTTTLLPAFFASCPYKAPFLKGLLSAGRMTLRNLVGRPEEDEGEVSRDIKYDAEVLRYTYETSKSLDVWEMVTSCVDLSQPLNSIRTLTALIDYPRVGNDLEVFNMFSTAESQSVLTSLIACIRKMIHRALKKSDGFQLGNEELSALVLMERLRWIRSPWDDLDTARFRMASVLLQAVLSIPSRDFLKNFISRRLKSPTLIDLPGKINDNSKLST